VSGRPSAEELEALALRLRGVRACHVEMDPERGEPRLVSLLVDAARRTAAARDLQSAFYAAFGILVPLSAFSVGTVPAPAAAPAAAGERFHLARLAFESAEGGGLRAVVTLRRGPVEATGVAEAAPGEGGLRAAACAALAALRCALPHLPPLGLDDAAVVAAGDGRAVLVRVRVAGRAGADHRLGVAAVRADPREAAVRAALAATNRLVAAAPPPR
jgi:hypothetical protein